VDEVLAANVWVAKKFGEVFCTKNDPEALSVPIVPTFGNNDILPHNILLSGPNKWLKTYTDIWSKFIPEEQRHGFERGGWFYVEVIPNQLAVFSLNTLYFFSHNAAVDGCALRSEPGFEHLEWLRIQLQFMRTRGMKAILIGHVPPARTESKQLWDETCWQKYTLWLQQYRDVVVGGIYGHMNIDHFMLQDTKDIDLILLEGKPSVDQAIRAQMEEELTIESASDYLQELRDSWSDLPNPVVTAEDEKAAKTKKTKKKKKKSKKSKRDKALKKIGGPWGERFHATFVSPSIVPNFFPTLRVIEYNITGLDRTAIWANTRPELELKQDIDLFEGSSVSYLDEFEDDDGVDTISENVDESFSLKTKKKGKKHKKPSLPDFVIPSPPSKCSPPGPAYSPQTLTLLGYTQYYANLTFLNNDFVDEVSPEDNANAEKWHEGKHHGNHPKSDVARPNPFQYQVEYDTFTDPIYKLKDMTVRSFIKLAHRIGQYTPQKGDEVDQAIPNLWEEETDDESDDKADHEIDAERGKEKKHKKKKKKGRRKHRKQDEKNKVWLRFIKRAFVGTLDEEESMNIKYEEPSDIGSDSTEIVTQVLPVSDRIPLEVHDGEL
jgi:endopolyphosphatase